MVLDRELISKLRDKVNESDFVYNTYKNIDDRNKWNCICSSMDWIEVSVDFINSDWNKSNEVNIKCMNFFTYISSINVLWEAIEQLHRVFINHKSIPFKGNTHIFRVKINSEDDNDYFKTIRACFGAHPVNLVEPSAPNSKSRKRFASWPYEDSFLSNYNNFSVRLYSNQINTEDLYLGINIDELNAFVVERYSYINEIINVIDRQYEDFQLEYRKRKISKSNDIVEQLNILMLEVEKRQAEDYRYIIEDILTINKVDSINSNNRNLLDKYKIDLEVVVQEIYSRLQSMDFRELETNSIINPKCPKALHYSYEKLNNAMCGSSELYAFGPIAEHLKDIIDFSEARSLEELYSLTLAGFYVLREK